MIIFFSLVFSQSNCEEHELQRDWCVAIFLWKSYTHPIQQEITIIWSSQNQKIQSEL